jgi:hypothetical protein
LFLTDNQLVKFYDATGTDLTYFSFLLGSIRKIAETRKLLVQEKGNNREENEEKRKKYSE